MSYFRHGDPLDDFELLDRNSVKSQERLPVCNDWRCRKRIDEDYYFRINGEILCTDCMNRRYRYETNNY